MLVLLVLGLPMVAQATDAGPGSEIRRLRHDVPILLAARIAYEKLSGSFVMDGIVVDANDAMVQWHVGAVQRIDLLERRFGVWWLVREVWITSKVSAMCCGGYYSPGSTAGVTPTFLKRLGFPEAIVSLASSRLPAVQDALARATPKPANPHGLIRSDVHGDGYEVEAIGFAKSTWQMPTALHGYQLSVQFAVNDATASSMVKNITGRPPTEAENWTRPGADGIFFFKGVVQSEKSVRFESGTKIDLWCPFILDASLRYSLTIANATSTVGPVTGKLDRKTNVVRFVLPAFTLPPAAELSGEVDGDPS